MDCTDCHFGKQRRKTFKKSLDRNIVKMNEMAFADLLIPGLHNGTKYSAVLVVMDGFSRFVTTYLLNSKTEDEVNGYMMQYVVWAERQHRRKVDTVVTRRWCAEEESSHEQDEAIGPVKQVLTDKDAEFCNKTIERWYATKGIVHTKIGPKSSQLNVVERTHQTLNGMVYFPTEHQKGFVADVKVNEVIKFKDRYDSGFKTKVNRWLQTFDEFLRDGDFDDAESDSEAS
ncbi:Integrase, catalytic core protein [Phytophthora cinnamomi]|uniref:Integrase, catalytic core protein n=1 Tax=Phytophthora cinnamomi TaxID=4785 RepID=UPI00355A7B62|nr:Integrase, catalytic core protein [Phytophthora cinnamomi]